MRAASSGQSPVWQRRPGDVVAGAGGGCRPVRQEVQSIGEPVVQGIRGGRREAVPAGVAVR